MKKVHLTADATGTLATCYELDCGHAYTMVYAEKLYLFSEKITTVNELAVALQRVAKK